MPLPTDRLNNERTSITSKLICYPFVSFSAFALLFRISFSRCCPFKIAFFFRLIISVQASIWEKKKQILVASSSQSTMRLKLYFIVLTFLGMKEKTKIIETVEIQNHNKWTKMCRLSCCSLLWCVVVLLFFHLSSCLFRHIVGIIHNIIWRYIQRVKRLLA